MVIGVHRAVGLLAHGADRRADAGGRAAGVTRGLDGRAALQLHAAALAVGIAGVAVLGAGGLLGVPQLCAAHMVIGIHRAVGLPAHGAHRRADAGGRAALVRSGQLLPRQHRQPHAAVRQPLADTFGIPRMRAVGTPVDQRRQHRAIGKLLGAHALRPQEEALAHRRVVGDLHAARDRAHIVAVGHRTLRAAGDAAHMAAARDRARVVAVGHRTRRAAGDAAHAVGADDRTGIAAGRHLALVIAHDAAGILGRAIPPAKPVNAHNDALVPAVQDGRPGISIPRDAAHIGPSVHIARHRQVFHRGALQPAEQPGRINCILNSGINDIFIAAAQTPDGVAAAVKGAGVGPLLAADGIQIVDRLTGSRCVTAIRVKRTAVDHDVVGQHGAQVGPAEPVHLQSEQQQLLHAADPAGILLRAAARCVAGHRCPVLVGRVALVDHLTVMLTALIEPAQESMPLLVRTLRHHGEKVLAQHLPRIGLAVRLIRQNVLLLPLVVPCHFPVAVPLTDDGTVDDLYRLILVKAAAADRAAHQGAFASAAAPALTRHLTVECTAGDGAAVLHRARKRASLDGALVRHRVLKRTVLDGAAHLVHHRARKRAAADGALALHSTGKHAVLDAAVALHLFGERGGACRSLASDDALLVRHLAVDGAAVCVQDALEIYAHIDPCIAADGKRAPAAEDMLLFALGSFCGDRAAADGRDAAEADAAAVAFFIADRDAVPDDAALHDEHAVVADTAALFAGYAAFDGAAVHDEPAALLPSAVDLHTAAAAVACSIVACDTAVDTGTRIHLEAALIADMHTAAAAAGVGIDNLAAYDAAALHDEGTVLYVYTAAAVGAAAIDNAAGNGLVAGIIPFPQMACVIGLKLVHRSGVAVHHRQLPAFAGFFVADHKHAVAAGLFQHLVVQIQCDLVCDLQRALGQLDIIRQPDTRLFLRQHIPQLCLAADLCIACELPFCRQGDVFCNGLLEVICRSVSFEPAVKGVVGLARLGAGLPRRRAVLRKMLGVHRAVRHVRHSDLAGKRDTGVDGAVTQHITRLLERAAADGAVHMFRHLALERAAGDSAALDAHITLKYAAGDGGLSLDAHVQPEIAAADGAAFAGHLVFKRAAADNTFVGHLRFKHRFGAAALCLNGAGAGIVQCRASARGLDTAAIGVHSACIVYAAGPAFGDLGAAAHSEGTAIVHAVSIAHSAAPVCGLTPGDAAALHREGTVAVVHAAADAAIASGDGAAFHDKGAAVMHTAASDIACLAAYDAAALHDKGAAFGDSHAPRAGCCELAVCAAVPQRQLRPVADTDRFLVARHRQRIAVQIQRGLTRDLQRAADAHVLRQRIHAVAQRRVLADGRAVQLVLRRGAARRQHLHRQQRQHHTQRHQCGNDPFFHACSSFSSAGAAPR